MVKIYSYTVNMEANRKIFLESCKKIEDNLPVTKAEPIEDVDGSIIQHYHYDGKKITLYNDYEDVNAVYIDSEVDLDDIFPDAFRIHNN